MKFMSSNSLKKLLALIKANFFQKSETIECVLTNIPTELSELNEDTTHRVVTDAEKALWNSKSSINLVADVFDATKKYAVNDVVVYDDVLYRCKTAITTAAAWDATKWNAISVDEGMYLHDKTVPSTHVSHVTGNIIPGIAYNITFSFSNNVSTAYTTGESLAAALYSAGYTGSNILTATGTVSTETVTGVNVSYDSATGYTFFMYGPASPASVAPAGLGGMSVADAVTGGSNLHPSAPSVDFSDSSAFPTLASINTYVEANKEQIMTMEAGYSLIMRFFGRSLVGSTLSMSTALGDTYDAATDTLNPASDCSFSGDPDERTLNIP